MPKTATLNDVIDHEFVRTAAQWPTIRDSAVHYGIPERFIRSAIERRRVEAIRLDLIRVNPDSLAAFLAISHLPAEHGHQH